MAERFWQKVDKDGPVPMHQPKLGPCWQWLGRPGVNGYGRVALERSTKTIMAHQASWEIHNGDRGTLWVLHRCDNRMCVRPDHLFLGTHDDNMADAVAKGRSTKGRARAKSRGTNNPRSKLTPAQVLEIRRRYVPRKVVRELADEFGVSMFTIHKIGTRGSWTYLEDDGSELIPPNAIGFKE